MTSWPTPSGFLSKLYMLLVGDAPAREGGGGSLSVSTSPTTPSQATPPPGLLAATSGTPARLPVPPGSVPPADQGEELHYGSPDLELWPPSAAELHMAGEIIAGSDDADFDGFHRVCGSVPRLRAVLALVERARRADALLARVDLL